jgi:AmiR/NasT family two-component response regulator
VRDAGERLTQSDKLAADNANLQAALTTRTVIGQAQGVLMARQEINEAEAFDVLRRASQRTNRKLRDIAADIVRSVQGGGPSE